MLSDEGQYTSYASPVGSGWRHGTANCYQYRKCRCSECRAANTARMRLIRERLAQREPPKHGLSAYRNYACRCDVCRAANAAQSRKTGRAFRARRKVRELAAWHETNVGLNAW